MTTPQPDIADLLGITYRRPIPDAEGWSKTLGEGVDGPAAPRPAMFNGTLGQLTRVLAPHVPWDPVAFHMQALVALGNYLGFGPYVAEGATLRRTNMFLAVIGATGSGKGSSLGFVRWLLEGLDTPYVNDRIITAVGSGEGLLAKITDPVYSSSPRGEDVLAIEGSDDKRVLYVEEELGALFNKMVSMESVEKMITKAWDSGVLETSTKKESMKCIQPHVSIIGHITPDELHERLDKRLLDNGFSNRWMFCLVKPTSKVHLEPQPHTIEGAPDLMMEIVRNVRAARDADMREMRFTPDAIDLFEQTSDTVTGHPFSGALIKQNVRWRSHMFKLASTYALIDGQDKIDVDHFAAARAAWGYNARSAAAFFAGLTGHAKADEFLSMWQTTDYRELSLTEITDMFSNHFSAHKRNMMLNKLARQGLVTVEEVQTGGRPKTVVHFTGDTSTSSPALGW